VGPKKIDCKKLKAQKGTENIETVGRKVSVIKRTGWSRRASRALEPEQKGGLLLF